MTRLIVCLDFDTEDIREAYRILKIVMADGANGLEQFPDLDEKYTGWETSDEAYDGKGNLIDADTLQSAIVEEFKQQQSVDKGSEN